MSILSKIIVSKGVPQGSIIGSLLYILYTDELDVLEDYTVLYSHQTILIFTVDNSELLLTKVTWYSWCSW